MPDVRVRAGFQGCGILSVAPAEDAGHEAHDLPLDQGQRLWSIIHLPKFGCG